MLETYCGGGAHRSNRKHKTDSPHVGQILVSESGTKTLVEDFRHNALVPEASTKILVPYSGTKLLHQNVQAESLVKKIKILTRHDTEYL